MLVTEVMYPSSGTSTVVSARPSHRAYVMGRIARVVDYVFSVLYLFLIVRLVLEFLRARRGAGFYQFIASVTDPFYAPFKSIIETRSVDGSPLVWPLVVALIAYMLLHGLVRGALHLLARSSRELGEANRA